ncbi:hypothetical protein LTR95_017538 [Oleoguttula sp. CCFEE 5521]
MKLQEEINTLQEEQGLTSLCGIMDMYNEQVEKHGGAEALEELRTELAGVQSAIETDLDNLREAAVTGERFEVMDKRNESFALRPIYWRSSLAPTRRMARLSRLRMKRF